VWFNESGSDELFATIRAGYRDRDIKISTTHKMGGADFIYDK